MIRVPPTTLSINPLYAYQFRDKVHAMAMYQELESEPVAVDDQGYVLENDHLVQAAVFLDMQDLTVILVESHEHIPDETLEHLGMGADA